MHERPLATVGGLVFSQDGEVLLVRSKKWNDLYTCPGGKIEWGETQEEAFRREVWEETNLKITHLQTAPVQECILSHECWQPRHFVMHDFIAELDPTFNKRDVVLNDEAYSYVWINPVLALQLPLQRECRCLIEWYLSKEKANENWGKVGFENLRIKCIIGALKEEREQEQDILVDLKAEVRMDACLLTDEVEETADYTALSALCCKLARENNYHLLESLANAIIKTSFELFEIRWIWVKIKKAAAIPDANWAFVEMEKHQRGPTWLGR
ncbi:MAG: dihydroneopterin aldolase [Candidatus Protochlamydia sp.]|nr:dihydroneopterin aldolase [Candidatus Protochlamydia sp.]